MTCRRARWARSANHGERPVPDLARVDFFVRDDGRVIINELNTMPGFTPISMFPHMWAETGIPYPDLLARLIRTAVARGTGLR